MVKLFVGIILIITLLGCEPTKLNQQPMLKMAQQQNVDIYISKGLVAEEVFSIKLDFKERVSKVQGKLISQTMNMGMVPLSFSDVEQRQFVAQSIVGACNLESMIWRLEIRWLTADGQQRFTSSPVSIRR